MADIKLAYAASANQTVSSGLDSLASSSTWVAGWEGDIIDNTTTKYTDIRVTVKLTAGTSLTAGEARVYFVGMLDDSTWPDVFDGTASAETVTNVQIRDAICKFGAATATTNTNSVVYYLDVPSLAAVFDGNLPAKCVPFITHSMVGALAASGNQVTVKGTYATVA